MSFSRPISSAIAPRPSVGGRQLRIVAISVRKLPAHLAAEQFIAVVTLPTTSTLSEPVPTLDVPSPQMRRPLPASPMAVGVRRPSMDRHGASTFRAVTPPTAVMIDSVLGSALTFTALDVIVPIHASNSEARAAGFVCQITSACGTVNCGSARVRMSDEWVPLSLVSRGEVKVTFSEEDVPGVLGEMSRARPTTAAALALRPGSAARSAHEAPKQEPSRIATVSRTVSVSELAVHQLPLSRKKSELLLLEIVCAKMTKSTLVVESLVGHQGHEAAWNTDVLEFDVPLYMTDVGITFRLHRFSAGIGEGSDTDQAFVGQVSSSLPATESDIHYLNLAFGSAMLDASLEATVTVRMREPQREGHSGRPTSAFPRDARRAWHAGSPRPDEAGSPPLLPPPTPAVPAPPSASSARLLGSSGRGWQRSSLEREGSGDRRSMESDLEERRASAGAISLSALGILPPSRPRSSSLDVPDVVETIERRTSTAFTESARPLMAQVDRLDRRLQRAEAAATIGPSGDGASASRLRPTGTTGSLRRPS